LYWRIVAGNYRSFDLGVPIVAGFDPLALDEFLDELPVEQMRS
jgi:hypothetical protein